MLKGGENTSPDYANWSEINRTVLDDMRGLLGIENDEQYQRFLDRVLDKNGKVKPESRDLEQDLLQVAKVHEGFFNKWGLPGGGFAKTWGMIKISRRRLSEISKRK